MRCAGTRRFAITLSMVLMLVVTGVAGVMAQPSPDEHFQRVWNRTDLPVEQGLVERTWMWGNTVTVPITEEYAQSPNGRRAVQYFDKSRMEVNQPDGDQNSAWYVTNGLLVVEMITGRVQTGDRAEEYIQLVPATVPVAGDLDIVSGPTYASFSALLEEPPAALHEALLSRIDLDGAVIQDRELGALGITATYIDEVTNHAIAEPFWEFMNSSGIVWSGVEYMTAGLFENPFFATGRPITEAYWAEVRVAKTKQLVLMQCFERRCLTYTPDNEPGWQVEAGNVGLHYYQWRFAETNAEGRLLFTGSAYSEELGRFVSEIFTMRIGVSAPQSYSYNLAGDDHSPVWSPNREQIAYVRGPEWDSYIYTVNDAGRGNRPLTHDGFSYNPVFSPDGSKIAFERQVTPKERQIFIMDADGSNHRQLTFIEPIDDSGSISMNPSWSPDGTQLVFSSWTGNLPPYDNVSTIYVINIDGSGLTALHEGPDADEPLWSPDGSRIAFVYQGGGGRDPIGTRLFVMNSNGSNVIEIRQDSGQPGRNDHHSPVWSPDGTRLAYAQQQGVFVVTVPYFNQFQLTEWGHSPAWSPDGQYIAFIYGGIFVVDAQGPGFAVIYTPVLVADGPALSLSWQP